MGKYDWKFGEHEYQRYYEARAEGCKLCVFENRWNPGVWMGMIDLSLVYDKTANDRQRRKQGLPKEASVHDLWSVAVLSGDSPEYMIRKVERAFARGVNEIGR